MTALDQPMVLTREPVAAVTRRKIEGIELLRFLLAFGVMIYHYGFYGPLAGKLPGVSPGPDWLVSGRFGVSAFFIISGFVIIYSAGTRGASAFALARLSRLMPAMLVCATITTLVLTLWPGSVPAPSLAVWARSASTLGLLAGSPYVDGSYWSITIELRFYVLVFLMLLALQSTRYIRPLVVGWMGLSFVAMAFYDFTPLRLLTLSPHGGYFIVGVILYCWLILGDTRFTLLTMPTALVLCAWQSYVEFGPVAELSGGQSTLVTGAGVALVSFALVRLMAFGITDPRLGKAARLLGAMSYPLYLLHQALGYRLIEGMIAGGLSMPLATAICAAGMCVAAFVISRFVEPVGHTFILNIGSRLGFNAKASAGGTQPKRAELKQPQGGPRAFVREAGGVADAASPGMNPYLSHWIDLFRWLGAFAVVIAHAGNRFVLPVSAVPKGSLTLSQYLFAFAQGFSHAGIMFFFVISGFLVGGTAFREASRSGGVDLRRFLGRRLARLWIVILPALALTLAFDGWGSAQGGVATEIYANIRSLGPSAAMCNVAFLQTVACDPYGTNGALWTLYNEFWYYLLCVALLIVVFGRGYSIRTRAALVFFVIVVALASVLQREGAPMVPYFLVWGLGAWAAVHPRAPGIHPALLVVGCVVAVVGFRVGVGVNLWDFGGAWGYVFDLVSMGLFAAFLCQLRYAPVALPRWIAAPSVVLAGFSFTLYCFHVPLMNVMAAFMETYWGIGWRDVARGFDWLRLAGQLGFILAFCYAMSRLTEAQTDRLRKRLLGR